MDRKRQLIALFLFALLAVAKVSSLHVFAHGDSEPAAVENCSWCHLAVVCEEAEFEVPEVQSLEVPISAEITTGVNPLTSESRFTSPIPLTLFSRPPPAVC